MTKKVVVLNAQKMNYDNSLDFSVPGFDVEVFADSTEAQTLERAQGADALVTKELVLSPELVAQLPETVKLICEAGTGFNNIPLDAVRAKGITVCNVPAYSSERVAQTAAMLMLNLASTMQKQLKMLFAGDHSNFTKHLQVPHVELNGKNLGIIGAGHIGSALIKIARAMDMNILIYTRHPKENQPGITYVDLPTLLKESDYVSLHCPLNESTRHIINAAALAQMKPSAFLINTSRGALIDEPALIEALQNGRIAGAGLDVQEKEPPADDNPLYTLENVILTPHMGWKGLETRQRLASVVVNDITSFFAGTPVNVVS